MEKTQGQEIMQSAEPRDISTAGDINKAARFRIKAGGALQESKADTAEQGEQGSKHQGAAQRTPDRPTNVCGKMCVCCTKRLACWCFGRAILSFLSPPGCSRLAG
jgi:hypothetical protein